MARFPTTSSVEVQELMEKAKNKNTSKATSNWMKVYCSWAELRGKEVNIENLSPEELDIVLQYFYVEVIKRDGSDYEPTSLSVMQAAIDRYLRNSGYMFSLLTSRAFASSRSVLEGIARLLRAKGMGKRPNKSCSLTANEEEAL